MDPILKKHPIRKARVYNGIIDALRKFFGIGRYSGEPAGCAMSVLKDSDGNIFGITKEGEKELLLSAEAIAVLGFGKTSTDAQRVALESLIAPSTRDHVTVNQASNGETITLSASVTKFTNTVDYTQADLTIRDPLYDGDLLIVEIDSAVTTVPQFIGGITETEPTPLVAGKSYAFVSVSGGFWRWLDLS